MKQSLMILVALAAVGACSKASGTTFCYKGEVCNGFLYDDKAKNVQMVMDGQPAGDKADLVDNGDGTFSAEVVFGPTVFKMADANTLEAWAKGKLETKKVYHKK